MCSPYVICSTVFKIHYSCGIQFLAKYSTCRQKCMNFEGRHEMWCFGYRTVSNCFGVLLWLFPSLLRSERQGLRPPGFWNVSTEVLYWLQALWRREDLYQVWKERGVRLELPYFSLLSTITALEQIPVFWCYITFMNVAYNFLFYEISLIQGFKHKTYCITAISSDIDLNSLQKLTQCRSMQIAWMLVATFYLVC